MEKKYSFLVLFLTLYTTIGISQTVIISPSGDGGFETGATFAANGWSATTGTATQNQWVCNTGATTGFSGNRAAYVTNNTAGTPPPHSYTNNATRVSHFYRNVTVPAGESHILLDFSWIGIAETTWDRMRVWLVPTGYNPVYGTEITATGTAPTGRVQVGLADYSNQASWTNTATIYLPAAYAGNTFRLVFEWRNDSSVGTNPPAGIDNISLTSEIPPPSYTIPSSGNNSIITCNGILYDSGGLGGNYVNNSNGYTVINPAIAGNYIQVSGTGNTESNWDFLYIYDGVGIGGTLLWSWINQGTGAFTVPTITSTSGALTVHFTSDVSANYSGFALNISCTDTLPPPEYTVPSSGNNSYTVCSGTLYDSGGSGGNYANNSNGYTVINPDLPGNYVQVSGTSAGENCCDWIRIYDGVGTGGTLLWESNPGAGTIPLITSLSGSLTVQFTSDFSVDGAGFALNINCSVTPGTEPSTPCSSVTDISSCGSIINATIPSGSSQSVISTSSCGWLTPGNEVIYTFTPSVSGQYTIQQNSSFGFIDYQYKPASTGCNATGWSCIDDLLGSSTSSTFFMSAGVQYYILADPENTTGGNISFVINCPPDPCTPGTGTGVTDLGCPNVLSGGLNLNGADPDPFFCTATSTCVELEANYLNLGNTSTYTVAPIPYNPPYQFNCLQNPVSVNIDDVWSPTVNLPFDFCFYGNTYNSCVVGSNGVISFLSSLANSDSGYEINYDIPHPSINSEFFGTTYFYGPSIYGVHHDINPSLGGEVGWELITLNTGCRALVVAYHNVPMFSCTSLLYTGMMVLYENTNVIEVYIKEKRICSWNNGNASVGIQNATGTQAVVAPGRNSLDTDWTVLPANGEAWRFTPAGTSITSLTWYEGSGTSGTVVGTTDVINVCPAATTTYTAEITYTLCDGRTITEIDETTVTVNGAKVWNGSIDTDWDKANNWTPTGIPTNLDCVVIPNTANDPIISGTNYNGLGLNMIIQDNASLTVNSDNAVTITDWININPNGDLILDNAASLIQVNDVLNLGTGQMHMYRDVNIRKLDYVYWSSPVTSFSSSLISPGTPTGLIWKWEPTVAGNGIGNAGTWLNGNENMAIGKGYIVRGPNSFNNTLQNFTTIFSGTPNNGNKTTSIHRGTYIGADYLTPYSSTLATEIDDNWNLVGNPYPSSVDAIDFLTANTNIAGFIKLWTHGTLPSTAIPDPFYDDYVFNYTIADYITYNATGTSSGPGIFNGKIASGQGFFVLMNHAGTTSQNISFNNGMRHHSFDNGEFFRIANTEKHRIWLDLIAVNDSHVRTLVGYITDATYEEDRMFDAVTDKKMSLNLYSLIGEEKMTIQGRAVPFDINDTVPLGISIPQAGAYKIALGALDGLFENTDQDIFLEDLETNIIHDLRESPYAFNTEVGIFDNRFVLRYKTHNLLNIPDTEFVNNIQIIRNDLLSVISTNQQIKSVRVFDVLGRHLIYKDNINNTEVVFETLLKNNSTLLLQITLEDGTIINKKALF